MRKTIMMAVIILALAAPAQASLLELPGFEFIIERVKDHGYAGRAWDIKGRPYQTIMLTLNDKGPFYVGIGAVVRTSGADEWDALLAVQYDAMHLWRSARKWGPIEKMELVSFPKDWRIPVGPLFNATRVLPNLIRIDRDLIFNAAINIPFGGKK